MIDATPVPLVEDGDTGDRFLIYQDDAGIRIELRYDADTLWMTQSQIADLFGVTRQAVNSHLTNIYADDELDREATCKEILQVRSEGGRDVARRTLIHNLDAIIAVGYRVSTKQGTLFRRWATDTLVRFATKGFVIDSTRLKRVEEVDRLAELREIIRDIRSDEANVYRELRKICSLCQDYDGDSPQWREFYTKTQAKIVYAVTSSTPAGIIRERADASRPDMGLTNWPHANIRKSDVAVSKNYLANGEITELNRLTSILLDIFEDQAAIGRLVMMDDAERCSIANSATSGASFSTTAAASRGRRRGRTPNTNTASGRPRTKHCVMRKRTNASLRLKLRKPLSPGQGPQGHDHTNRHWRLDL